jgi:Holliday junction resolvase RusA-like endonuclease
MREKLFFGDYHYLKVVFYFKNKPVSDLDNLLKALQDNLQKAGVLADDKYLNKVVAIKKQSNTDKIKITLK